MVKTKENKMGTMPVFKLLISMAIPMVISMLIQSLYNVVDSIYVGKFSNDALTAVGLAWPMQNLIIALSTGVGVGINAILSKSLGEHNQLKASKTAVNGCYIMLVIFLIFLILGIFLVPTYMNSLSGKSTVVEYGISYLKIILIGCFGLIFSITTEKLLQATGRTILVMVTQGIGAIINIILDPIFIFDLNMGIEGAAIATLIGQYASCIIGILLNVFLNKDIKFNKESIKLDFSIIKEVLLIGIPSAVMASISSILTFLFNKILLSFYYINMPGTNTLYEDIPQTVFGLYFKLNSLFFMPIFGINNAVVPIVAYNYGAKNKQKMMLTMKYSLLLVSFMMLLGTTAFLVIPRELLSIFAESEEVANQLASVGVPCLRIISSSFIIAAFCIVIMSMFQALGNGFYSMACSITRQLIVLLPVAYLFSLTKNLNLVWLSFLVAEIVCLGLSIALFVRLYKSKIKPLDNLNTVIA